MQELIQLISRMIFAGMFIIGFAAGVLAGHFHGKAETLERFVLTTQTAMEIK
jgi:hypothetical protein